MAKLFLAACTSILVALCLGACSNHSSYTESAEYQKYLDSIRTKTWKVLALVDEFGDATGDAAYAKDFTDGSFSSHYVNNALLTGYFKKDRRIKSLCFRPLENGSSNTIIRDEMPYELKFKDDSGYVKVITGERATARNAVWIAGEGQKAILSYKGPRKYVLTVGNCESNIVVYKFTFDSTGLPENALGEDEK